MQTASNAKTHHRSPMSLAYTFALKGFSVRPRTISRRIAVQARRRISEVRRGSPFPLRCACRAPAQPGEEVRHDLGKLQCTTLKWPSTFGPSPFTLYPRCAKRTPSHAKGVARAWGLRARPVLSPAAVVPTGIKFYRVMKLAMKFEMKSVMKFCETAVFSRGFGS